MKTYIFNKFVKFLDKKGYDVIKKDEHLLVLKHFKMIPKHEGAKFHVKGGKAEIIDNTFYSFRKKDLGKTQEIEAGKGYELFDKKYKLID